MNYITNESGDVKVRHVKGKEKWLPKKLAEDKKLMERMDLTVVEAPLKFEAKVSEVETPEIEPEQTEVINTVAEKAPAKTGKLKK